MTRLVSHPCVAFGVPFLVCAESDATLAQTMECVPYATELSGQTLSDAMRFALVRDSVEGFRVMGGDTVLAVEARLAPALEQMGRHLMVHVADAAPDYVFVHAGVVAWKGRALVLPGRSLAGKTTLVSELLRAGATYYSDEYAVVDAEGRVHPYARDLRMRRPGSEEQSNLPVAALNAKTGVGALAVRCVAFTEYEAGSSWRPEPVSAGMAALEMMRHAVPVQRAPARVMATLTTMMAAARAWRSPRGEADETARALLAMMEAEGSQPGAAR